MNQLLTLLRGSGAPPARLDHARFETFFGLEINELLGFLALALVMPLVTWNLPLPEPAHLMTVLAFPACAGLLFFIKHEDHTLLYWLGRMVPYWTRQHVFHARTAIGGRVSARSERVDDDELASHNALSFEWRDGADGGAELHIYEEPLRPYRAWVAARGRAIGLPSEVALPGAKGEPA